jgi:hypothetical protein
MKLTPQYLKKNCFLLLLCLMMAGCTSAPKQENEDAPETEEAQETGTLEDSSDEDDKLLTEYGLIQAVEGGAYPMYTITVKFPERNMIKTFSLNAEELQPRIEQLISLVGKYATIKYTSTLEPSLLDLRTKDKMIMGSGKIDPSGKRISGKLTGAEEITNSDLPGAVQVSNDSQTIEFRFYVYEEIQAVNGKFVEANYTLRSINRIKSIIPSTESDKEESADKTVATSRDLADDEYPSGTMMVNNSYLILLSTKSYSAAMYAAKQARAKLDLPINYRGYVFDFKEGLKDTTACGCGEIHGYVPRGRFDDGNYISIEHTNSFTEFANGYYIVVAASGDRKKINPTLAKAKEFFADAYIKDAEVYIGCMH